MIHSMTGFARAQNQGEWGSLTLEIRSINHRYLEMSVHLPDALHELEMPVREHIKEEIKRGKIECQVRYQPSEQSGATIAVNTALAKQIVLATEQISELLTNPAPVQPTDILRWPGIVQIAEIDLEVLEEVIFALLHHAIKDLVAARAREGEELRALFLQKLTAMKMEIDKVRTNLPVIMKEQRERLIKRFADAQLELNSERLEQEMLILAQKTDVLEEIERLETHINEVKRLLKQGGMMGRRLDFLMQELNREANTLGSKATESTTTHAAVELKVLIEQMREQVQNVE